jgi:hypothetical protein
LVRELHKCGDRRWDGNPKEEDKPMAPKATRKSSKQLEKGKKIQPVKNLRLAVRKAGENPRLEY